MNTNVLIVWGFAVVMMAFSMTIYRVREIQVDVLSINRKLDAIAMPAPDSPAVPVELRGGKPN